MEKSSLLIEKVIVENFGPFAGKQELVFPIDVQKKINVIVGENAVGKTQLFNAILWCLFGKREQVMYEGEEELFLNSSIAKNLKEGQSATAKVEVILNIDKKSQTVSREIQFKKTNGKIDIDSTNLKNQNLVSTLPPSHLIFVSDQKIGSVLETYNQEKGKNSENLEKIVDKMNSINQKSSFSYFKNLKFQIMNDKIQLVGDRDPLELQALWKKKILDCMFLSAIREILLPNSVLILDDPFVRVDMDFHMPICNFMMFSIPQLIFLISPFQYQNFSEKIGIVYKLIRNQETGITSIKRIE